MVSRPKKKKKKVAGKNLGGRPPFLNEADKRGSLVRVLTTASELKELKVAAAYVGETLSTWARRVILERARAVAAEKEAARDRDEQ
jgi:hypothetical protein